MEPPKAKITHKKRGNIYFAGTCLVSGPFEIKDNEMFGAEGGNKAMKASVEKKKGIKTKINALQDSLFMKRNSRLGKKPPHSTIKYQHIKHYYQYAQEENIVILALQQPKMRKQYIALKFEDAATTAKFCDIVQYASVAPSHNLKNAAPMPEPPVVMASGRQSAQSPSAPASVIEETAVSPPRALTPSRPTENQMILASNNFHPLSVLTKNGTAENSLNDMCSICGAVGEGGPMELKVLRVDVDGQPKISPDGAVYMYSSTKRLTPEDSENVSGYQRRPSQIHPSQTQSSQSQPSHHRHRHHRNDDDYKKNKEETEYKFQFLRLDNSSSSSDSEDSISGGPRSGGTFNIRHI
ncbi:unnamed protein product [Dibothriocephalus latus]|uniref:Trematode PH-like domain-containing protein n=1 Tax=Dibothriocephalus latus TaxID=60516 RepID=A0A3P7P3G6_DIBLA|nr:unnamed protein product [Dibothriocephalus latus]